MIIAMLAGTITAQTQIANNTFEQWTSTAKDVAIPKGWHSYGDGDCQLKGIYSWGCGPMLKNHSNRVTGHSGYGCEIHSVTLAGNLVNGVLTTGQMQFASAENSSSDNNTYTDKDNKLGHNAAMKFTGRPDSVYFWCKFEMKKPSNVAVAKFHIHGNIAYKDISTHSASTPQKGKIANAFCDIKDRNDGKWHQYKYKFDATRAAGRHLLLIDDIVMVYNKRLSYINIDGIALPDFAPDRTEYTWYCDGSGRIPQVEAEAQSPHAKVRIEQQNQAIRIIVCHDDGEKVYTVELVDSGLTMAR